MIQDYCDIMGQNLNIIQMARLKTYEFNQFDVVTNLKSHGVK